MRMSISIVLLVAITVTASAASAQETASTFSVGSIAGEVVVAIAVAFGSAIAGLVVKILMTAAARAGFDLDDRRRERLQQIAENAIHFAAIQAGKSLDDKLQVTVKNDLVAKAVDYFREHAAETIVKLGGDPDDRDALEEIVKGRAGYLLNDPAMISATVPR